MSDESETYLLALFNALVAGLNAALFAADGRPFSFGATVVCGILSLGLFVKAAAA